MKELVQQAAQFKKTFKQPVAHSPTIPSEKEIILRCNLAQEELAEFYEACLAKDHVEVFDSLVDQLYVLIGTAHSCGMGAALEAGFKEVHRSNMTKLGANGLPIFREDGKIIKGPNYEEPNLKQVLENIYSK